MRDCKFQATHMTTMHHTHTQPVTHGVDGMHMLHGASHKDRHKDRDKPVLAQCTAHKRFSLSTNQQPVKPAHADLPTVRQPATTSPREHLCLSTIDQKNAGTPVQPGYATNLLWGHATRPLQLGHACIQNQPVAMHTAQCLQPYHAVTRTACTQPKAKHAHAMVAIVLAAGCPINQYARLRFTDAAWCRFPALPTQKTALSTRANQKMPLSYATGVPQGLCTYIPLSKLRKAGAAKALLQMSCDAHRCSSRLHTAHQANMPIHRHKLVHSAHDV